MTPSKRKSTPRRDNPSSPAAAGNTPGVQQVTRLPFPVVGVGASAGGLEAFMQLLRALESKLGMAIVLVPHLDPSHESAMSEILARATKLPVLQVTDRMRVK